MKKWLVLAIALLSCVVVQASSIERIEVLSSKAILKNANGYFALSDGSLWKAVGFEKRWRTPSEWWNNVQLVPENYECVPNDWFLGAQIQIYSKYDNLEVNEANASNQEALKQCTHLLVNTRSGQVLFATELDPAECVIRLFNDAFQDGYQSGYSKGRLESYKDASEIYNSGHADGFKAGYEEGFQDGFRE